MSSIVRNRVGKYIYLYNSESYRDENGKPQTRKTAIGKIDAKTGEPIYKPEYLEQVMGSDKEPDLCNAKIFSEDDIKRSDIREYGVFYLLKSISDKIGLTKIIESIFPNTSRRILMLAFYMAATGDPAMYLEDWLLKSESLPCGNLSSQKVSELLSVITNADRTAFYEKWGELRSEQEYIALDITSVSSYSELIGDVGWGYNRDKEKLPQVNVCMLLGENSKLPVLQTIFNGSIKDVSTLRSTLQTASGLKLDNLSIVMDKGFCSKQNIGSMLDDERTRFVIAMPFTMNFAKEQIASERKDIDTLEKTITLGGDIFRAVTKIRSWSPKHTVFTHVYLNASFAAQARDELYGHVSKLKCEALKCPDNAEFAADFQRYLIIRKARNDTGYTINIRHDVIEKELERSGWLVIISNHIQNAYDALAVYRAKDVVEKGFLKMKNCLDLSRLRVHSGLRMQNKLFIGFIALIIMSYIHKVMSDSGLYSSMTMNKLVKTLERFRVQYINGRKIIYPLTALQKKIFNAFSFALPE